MHFIYLLFLFSVTFLFSRESYLSFDGVDDFVSVPDSETLQLTDNLTLSVKFKDDLSSGGNGFAMVSKQCGAASPQSEDNCQAGAFGCAEMVLY